MFSRKFLLLLICVTCYFSSSNSFIIKYNEDQLHIGLNKLINYLIMNSMKVNANCLFGIVIAEAQLSLALQTPLNNRNYIKTRQLREKCHELIEMIKPNIIAPNKYIKNILKHVIKTELWEINSRFSNGELKYLKAYVWNKSDPVWSEYIMFDGSPDEQQSDICINDVIEEQIFHNKCTPNEMCRSIMFDLNGSHGYPLTHKLLYLQVARALNCSADLRTIQSKINYLCSRILQEYKSIVIANETKLRDLYLEQMVLCGMEGYTEFLDEKARESLLQWQHEIGCYGHDKEVHRIADSWHHEPITETCSNHFSGLAAAAYALHLRYLNYNQQNVHVK